MTLNERIRRHERSTTRRTADPGDPKHEASTRTISELLEAGETLCITPQIAAEFWNVATRPVVNNGLGMSIEEVRDEISRLEDFFSVLPESAEVYSEWKRLVAEHKVQGVKVHARGLLRRCTSTALTE